MLNLSPPDSASKWRKEIYSIVFESETPAGKAFDVALLWAIILSVTVVFLESIQALKLQFGNIFYLFEWFFTILFTIEYILRLICVNKALRYARSFFGVVDLLAVLPTYLSLVLAGSQYFLMIRILRLLRVFRIFKLTHFITQAEVLKKALLVSRLKIMIFLFTVLSIVVIICAMMYVIEGPENGFTSIPTSIYWTIVTLTTVGYGDIFPRTPAGQFLESIVMLTGYTIIAVPTGIVSVEIAEATRRSTEMRVCSSCLGEGHDKDAVHCKYCGNKL
jgi:voltage-gated potassium channel